MGISLMGKVLVSVKVENLSDFVKVEEGTLSPDQVRSVDIPDALVDTGATFLSLPKHLVAELGLRQYQTRRARTTNGIRDVNVFSSVRLTVQGRECRVSVAEVPDDCPVLIGQIPLEDLDLVVDPAGQRLIGNPDHGGEQMIELFSLGSPARPWINFAGLRGGDRWLHRKSSDFRYASSSASARNARDWLGGSLRFSLSCGGSHAASVRLPPGTPGGSGAVKQHTTEARWTQRIARNQTRR
jgi:clan AA aspartic protease